MSSSSFNVLYGTGSMMITMLHGLAVENLLSTDVSTVSAMLLKQIYFNPQ